MQWIWQLKDWSHFDYDASFLSEFEKEFYKNAGIIIGSINHLKADNVEQIRIEILTQEAVSTSSIEGEILQRESVQSSIRKHLGLKTDNRKIQPNEAGVSEMMVNVLLNYEKPLTHETLYTWHAMLMNGKRDIDNIGNYRSHTEPMQIVSGSISNPKVFYEAPPSSEVHSEMENFITWYNTQCADSNFSAIVLAGIAHLYFEVIHPFEDGNGRIGRALVEHAISQKLKTPALLSFSKIIEQRKKEYYTALQSCNHSLNVNKWLIFFSSIVLESQKHTIKTVDFLVAKTKFFLKHNDNLNARQTKVLLRIFEEGLDGFKGGLSAANYISISGTSNATATRDLHDLVIQKVLIKSGELKGSRYMLNLEV